MAAGAFFPVNIVKKRETYETAYFYVLRQVDFQGPFLKFKNKNPTKTDFVLVANLRLFGSFKFQGRAQQGHLAPFFRGDGFP